MTVREKMAKQLVVYGLMPDEANAVITNAECDSSLEEMKGRWGEDIEGAIQHLLSAIWPPIVALAVAWLDKYDPGHLAQPYLVREQLEGEQCPKLYRPLRG